MSCQLEPHAPKISGGGGAVTLTQSLEEVWAGACTETNTLFLHCSWLRRVCTCPAHVKASVALLMSLSSSDQTVFGRLSVRTGEAVVLGRDSRNHPHDDYVITGTGRFSPDVVLMLFNVGKMVHLLLRTEKCRKNTHQCVCVCCHSGV